MNCLLEKEDYASAAQILNVILPLCIEMNEVSFLPELYIAQARIQLHETRPDEALITVKRAADIVLDDDGYSWPRVQYTMGNVLWALGKKAEAENCFSSAISKANSAGFRFVLGLAHYNYASFLQETGSIVEAGLSLNQAIEIFQSLAATKRSEKALSLKQAMSSRAD